MMYLASSSNKALLDSNKTYQRMTWYIFSRTSGIKVRSKKVNYDCWSKGMLSLTN